MTGIHVVVDVIPPFATKRFIPPSQSLNNLQLLCFQQINQCPVRLETPVKPTIFSLKAFAQRALLKHAVPALQHPRPYKPAGGCQTSNYTIVDPKQLQKWHIKFGVFSPTALALGSLAISKGPAKALRTPTVDCLGKQHII